MRRNTKKVALGALILGLMMCTAVGCDNANEKSEYNVYKSADASYTVSGENVAKAGEDYTFTVTPKAGYDASEMKVVVNGKEIKAVDGKYTVSAVSDSLAIYVSGVKAPETEYVDVFFSGDHVDFTGEAKAEKGKDYSFKAVAYDGYQIDEVKNGETVLNAVDGVYTVSANENIEIIATASVVVKYDFNVVSGDTPSEGGSVVIGEDGRTHLKVSYNPNDRFMKPGSDTDCYYSEVGFKLSDEAWASAHTGANMAIVTLRVDWGEQIAEDINAASGASVWMVEDGLQDFGGNMQWPGISYGDHITEDGKIVKLRLAKNDKIAVRTVDGFDATVLDIEFKTMENVLAEGKDLTPNTNVAMDENKEVYVSFAGDATFTLDMTKIFGEEVKGKTVRIDVIILDDVKGNNNVGGGVNLKEYKTHNFTNVVAADGTLQLVNIGVRGLAKLHFTIVEA